MKHDVSRKSAVCGERAHFESQHIAMKPHDASDVKSHELRITGELDCLPKPECRVYHLLENQQLPTARRKALHVISLARHSSVGSGTT